MTALVCASCGFTFDVDDEGGEDADDAPCMECGAPDVYVEADDTEDGAIAGS